MILEEKYRGSWKEHANRMSSERISNNIPNDKP
jgi:hypothetical protein